MIEYIFRLDNGSVHRFSVDPARANEGEAAQAQPDSPRWLKLDYHRCTNCPLKGDTHALCPVAVDLRDVVRGFSELDSTATGLVQVIAPEREYSKRCDVQTGLSSLMGLIMASSACPILSRLRRMAFYHLPFASMEETLFRTVASYLLEQYFVTREGGVPDLELKQLAILYQELQVLNRCFVGRLRAAAEHDANLNAVTMLSTLSFLVTFSLEDKLEELKPRFRGRR